ncbi:MAG: aminoacyl-histidine dipeptidase [Bacteroidales bacterium]|nr:aminoacyl-histidine dipeptidase [Bacteroidales bacterium]MCF8390421.1 aminoacyl-histidine dipeptidase [Bacteroidales bacterium]
MSTIKNLYPKNVWGIFHDLTQIPRPSKKEQAAAEYAKKFGEKLGLKTIVDEIGNVIISKPATPGLENRMGIVLQAHLDMVPQKNSDKVHDFEKDPIETMIDGEWVTANGTTLGADNGIGVAAALAVLASDDLVHGPLEALLTIDEETGMTGAFELKSGVLKGDILLNLDSEDEGELYIGCAGGMNTSGSFDYKQVGSPAGYLAYQLILRGLKGGHSGLDINLGRGNAIKLMNRFLWEATKKMDLKIASFEGGSLRNAIPREAFVTVLVKESKKSELEKLVSEFNKVFIHEYQGAEPNLSFSTKPVDVPEKVMHEEAQDRFIKMVYGIPNGVMRMSAEMPEIVETSINLAIVKAIKGEVSALCLIRSSVDSAKFNVGNATQAVMELAGATVIHDGTYPGWKPNLNSPILKTMKTVYNDKFGKVPEIKVIHAGLECGIIGDAYPEMDLISFGPTIRFPHSPDEKINIKTVGLFWDYLVETLKAAPVK